ncbi:FecR family protein [Gluconacetobacter sp. Hr-1-5]|uniref:FecR family protein n=1 Tax=Gluconacetobacter sp. Hr-1-5 TaxID=3395370 RepID=UPI003B51AF27
MIDSNLSHDRAATEAARHWIARLSSGDITEEEMAAYKLWVADEGHHAVFRHELQLWRSLDLIGDSLAPHSPVAVQAARTRRGRQRAVFASLSAIAACLALLFATPDVVTRLRADHWTANRIEALVLPDGSHAVLDADTALAVHYDHGMRTIALLRGRAWFDVRHDAARPFRVEAAGSVTEDIGTAFETDRRMTDGSVGTAVERGVVRVSSGGGGPFVTLTAGQRALWHGDRVSREPDIVPDTVAPWRDGQLMLTSVSVRSAIQAIARYRDGRTFILGNIDDLPPVTALVDARKPDEALTVLAEGTRIRIYRLPGGIVIVRRNS